MSDYSLYKRSVCLTKGFLETAKLHGGLEHLFCFIICSLEATEEEEKGVTNFQWKIRQER